MKIKLTLCLAVAAVFSLKSQVQISEDFNDPFNPTTAGWVIVNNSSPTNTLSWTQGNQFNGNGFLNAYNGFPDDYYGADFATIPGTGAGDIAAWLITPQVTIYNGAILQFATTTMSFTSPNIYPDRLQVRMSQTGNTAIPTGTASFGSFTNLMLDINPTLSTNNSSVVSNGTVNGYPMSWAVYTLQVTGVTGTVSGRFAFVYYVENGGQGGANSRLVGVDAVRYTLPCGVSAQSFTTCAGQSVNLVSTGGIATTTYSWSNGSTSSSITVNPVSTTVYSLYPMVNNSNLCSIQEVTVAIGSGASINIFATQQTVCTGSSATLNAVTAGNYVQWVNSGGPIGSGNVISVTPTSGGSTYSVVAGYGTFPAITCTNIAQVTINTFPLPTVTILGNTLVCRGTVSTTASFTGSGASLYLWTVGTDQYFTNSLNFPFAAINSTTQPSNTQIQILGVDANGCVDGFTTNLVANLQPSVTVVASKSVICAGNPITFTASGAASYSWTSGSSTVATNVYTTTTSTGNKQMGVTGKSANGCSADAVANYVVNACTGIEKVEGSGFEAAVFPNPFNNTLNVSGFEGTIEVYNSLGQIVIRSAVSETQAINTTELPKGAYILKAYDTAGATIRTIKLLKN